MKIINVPINRILRPSFSMRTGETSESLSSLAESISHIGIIQPVILNSVYNFYEIISGSRRLEAAKLLGIKNIPAVVIKASNAESMNIALADNIQRKSLSYFDEAVSFQTIMSYYGISKSEISEITGTDESYISKRLSVLSLNKEEKNILRQNNISLDNTLGFLKLDNPSRKMIISSFAKNKKYVSLENKLLQENLNKSVENIPIGNDISYFSEFIKTSVNQMKEHGFETSFIMMKGFNSCSINIKISSAN